jgi:hypothetical protein
MLRVLTSQNQHILKHKPDHVILLIQSHQWLPIILKPNQTQSLHEVSESA